MFRRLAAVSIASVMLAGSLLPAAAPPPHPALARGLALMREGDFEAAVLELDAAVRKIEADPAAGGHRAWAYVHLGVAYLELEQEAVARGKFREALARDRGLQLLPAEFSAQSIRVFEDVRAEAAVAAASAPVRAPRPSGPSIPAAREKKGSKGALVAVLVGGAAAAGAAVALGGGGGGGGSGTTTTTAPIGGGSTTLPGPSPSPEPPTTTTPATPTTTTPAPTTTTQPACTYSLGGATPPAFPFQGGSGTCRVTTSRSDCSWTAVTSASWIALQRAAGNGAGDVSFNVEANTSLSSRSAAIRLLEGNQPSCTVNQAAALSVLAAAESGLSSISDLDVPGGQGQVIVDGASVAYQTRTVVMAIGVGKGVHRVEALLVSAAGRPGTWRFQLPAAAQAGSLRVVAGDVAAIAADTVTFRLAGRPGERLVFTFALR
jgi:hypothetical protein